jgi:hypothetical protein
MNNDTRIELEALITEREGYIAENIHRQLCGNSIAYGADVFDDLANKIRALKQEANDGD